MLTTAAADSGRRPCRFIASLLLPVVLTGLACSGGRSTAGQPSRPPNIVFVLVDDLRWDDIRVAGHPFVETPNIDRVAREGVRFVNAFRHDAAALAEPRQFSHGQYAHTNGII